MLGMLLLASVRLSLFQRVPQLKAANLPQNNPFLEWSESRSVMSYFLQSMDYIVMEFSRPEYWSV